MVCPLWKDLNKYQMTGINSSFSRTNVGVKVGSKTHSPAAVNEYAADTRYTALAYRADNLIFRKIFIDPSIKLRIGIKTTVVVRIVIFIRIHILVISIKGRNMDFLHFRRVFCETSFCVSSDGIRLSLGIRLLKILKSAVSPILLRTYHIQISS